MTRVTGCFALLGVAAAPLAAQVEPRTLSPDAAGPLRQFWSDTIVQRVELRGGTLEVLAERDHANAAATTGRYVIRWNGLQVSVSDDSLGALPLVNAVFPGRPSVVVLAARTHIRVIVLEPAREGGSVAARSYVVNVPGDSVDALRALSGPENGSFAIGTDAFALRYSGGTLRLEGAAPRAARAGGPSLVSSGESDYVEAMRTDLRALLAAEEAFFANGSRYSDRLQALNVRLAPGNRLMRLRLSADGWGALMGNPSTRTVCAVYVGSTAVAPATKPGEPACI